MRATATALVVLAAGCIYAGPYRSASPEGTAAGAPRRCPEEALASFDAFVESVEGDALEEALAPSRGCRIDWEAIVFNGEVIPASEHPDASRRDGGEMERLLLMSPRNPAEVPFVELPPRRRLMLAVPEGMGEGYENVRRGDRVRVSGKIWTAAGTPDWPLVWVRDYRLVRSPHE